MKGREDRSVPMEDERKDKTFIPEKYGMIFCPQCNGLGKIYGSGREAQVCMLCGGFGAIKNPDKKAIHKHRGLESPKKGISPG